MPELLLTCAQCQRQLRVPAELLGRPVKCPACGFTFTAHGGNSFSPPERPPSFGPAADSSPEQYQEPAWQAARDFEASPAAAQAQARILGPALCLLVTAALALLGSLYVLSTMNSRGDELRAQLLQDIQRRFENDPELRKRFVGNPEPLVDFVLQVFAGMHYYGVTLAVITVVAMIQMLRLRMYWLAVLGSILAMLNVGCATFLLGLPFGIWSLVVLLRPEIKESFRS